MAKTYTTYEVRRVSDDKWIGEFQDREMAEKRVEEGKRRHTEWKIVPKRHRVKKNNPPAWWVAGCNTEAEYRGTVKYNTEASLNWQMMNI